MTHFRCIDYTFKVYRKSKVLWQKSDRSSFNKSICAKLVDDVLTWSSVFLLWDVDMWGWLIHLIYYFLLIYLIRWTFYISFQVFLVFSLLSCDDLAFYSFVRCHPSFILWIWPYTKYKNIIEYKKKTCLFELLSEIYHMGIYFI